MGKLKAYTILGSSYAALNLIQWRKYPYKICRKSVFTRFILCFYGARCECQDAG